MTAPQEVSDGTQVCARCGHETHGCSRCGRDDSLLGSQINDARYCHISSVEYPTCYMLAMREIPAVYADADPSSPTFGTTQSTNMETLWQIDQMLGAFIWGRR